MFWVRLICSRVTTGLTWQLRYLKDAYNAGNNAPDLLEFIAKAYYELGELDMAYQWYKLAEEKYPTDRLFMALGNVAFKLGEYEESARYYTRSVETTKDDLLKKTGLFQLAQLYYDIGNYLKGLEGPGISGVYAGKELRILGFFLLKLIMNWEKLGKLAGPGMLSRELILNM